MIKFDKKIIVSGANRLWTAATGLITALLITEFLTPQHQGYYYTFLSLGALQIFVEMGLSFAIIQITANECSGKKLSEIIFAEEHSIAADRLSSLLAYVVTYFALAMIVLVVLLWGVGYATLKAAAQNEASFGFLLAAWVAYAVFVSLTLILNGLFAFLEGGDYIAEVAIIRLWQAITYTLTVWAALYLGWDLASLPMAVGGGFVVASILLYRRFGFLLSEVRRKNRGRFVISVRTEIWPFQKRIALSWAAGYFISQIYVPVILIKEGAVSAGRYGLTFQILSGLLNLSVLWFSTKVPQMAYLHQTASSAIRRQFVNKNLLFSYLFLCLSVLVVWLLFFIARKNELAFLERVADIQTSAFLSAAFLISNYTMCIAAYLRAKKQEPFVSVSVGNAVLTLPLLFLALSAYGVTGAALSYLLIVIIAAVAARVFLLRDLR